MPERYWIENFFKEVLKKIPPDVELTEEKLKKLHILFGETFEEMVPEFERIFYGTAFEILKENQEKKENFKNRIIETWKEAFDLLEIFISMNDEFAERVIDSYSRVNNNDQKFQTIIRLHARACKIAHEILVLLKGGFADGAMARWRTLYEISVIATFLSDKPDLLIQKYLAYYLIENHQEILEYQKNYEKLGFEPLDLEVVKESEADVKKLEEQYGKEFTGRYGWASDYLDKKKRSFAGIEETVEFKELKSFYKMANNKVHGGAKAIIHQLGLYRQDATILAGPSNYGFADPGQFTAVSLFQITLLLARFEDCLENKFYTRVAENLCKRVSQSFVKIQEKLEEDYDNFTQTHN